VALAILSRAVPQLTAMMVAFPATIGVGLLMFGAAVPLLGATLAGWTEGLPRTIQTLLTAFGPPPGV
jgi:flagellar biosynthesis protein FliR